MPHIAKAAEECHKTGTTPYVDLSPQEMKQFTRERFSKAVAKSAA
jgi:hypothetical protein